nr:MAG TPA: putative homing endonuclease/beta fold, HYDROLASE [Caudoviricetes sp.]
MKYKYNLDFFKNDSSEKYYFYGFLASDGYISDDKISIGINVKDREILEKFQKLICPEKPIYEKIQTNSLKFEITNKDLSKELKKYFSMTTNKKHEEIRFPNVPEKYLKDFIRGVIDGDGNIDTTKGYQKDKIYIGARLRILGNKEFLIELNEKTKLLYPHNTNAVNKKGKENVYTVTYNFKTARELLKIIYYDGCLSLTRKFNRSRDEDIVSTITKVIDKKK